MKRRLFLQTTGGTSAAVASGLFSMHAKASTGAIHILVHFAENDYEESLVKNLKTYRSLNAELLERSYMHVDYSGEVKKSFISAHSFDDTAEVLGRSRIVITCSPDMAIAADQAGARPIFVTCNQTGATDREQLVALKIPIVENHDRRQLMNAVHAAERMLATAV